MAPMTPNGPAGRRIGALGVIGGGSGRDRWCEKHATSGRLVDLEARLTEVVTAVHEGRAAETLSERFSYDVDGAKGDREAALAWLAGRGLDGSKVRVVSVKRNLLFLDWSWPKVGVGMAIVAFDQDGKVASVSARKRA